MDTNKISDMGFIHPTRSVRNMSFDLGSYQANARTRSYITRRGSIKKDSTMPSFPNDKFAALGISGISNVGDVEVPKKKLKTTAKDRKATMKNSYINGIKK